MFLFVTQANVLLALDELQSEYASVINAIDEKRRELTALEDRGDRLQHAVESLKRVVELESVGDADSAPTSDAELEVAVDDDDNSEFGLDEPLVEESLVSAGSPIAKYIKRGGKGRRLSSTSMIGDLVDEQPRLFTRDELKDAFFEKFSREEMERFWDRPDNAFGTALARAVKEGLIKQGTHKGADVYASSEFVRRLNAKDTAKAGDDGEAVREEARAENGEL